MHSPQLVLGLFPEWFASPQTDWPPNVHLTGFSLYDESDSREIPGGLQKFLSGGEPPIVFTAGSAMTQDAEFFRTSVVVCCEGHWSGLLRTRFPEQLPANLPNGVRHFKYVPFSMVLSRAATFVHHGWIGTVAQAPAAGVRQLVVPLAHDQPENVMCVRRLGIGDIVLQRNYAVKTVLDRLHRLLESPDVTKNCRRRAADLASNNDRERTCDLIEQLGKGGNSCAWE